MSKQDKVGAGIRARFCGLAAHEECARQNRHATQASVGQEKRRLRHLSFQGPTALFASQQGGFCTMGPFHARARQPAVQVYWPASA